MLLQLGHDLQRLARGEAALIGHVHRPSAPVRGRHHGTVDRSCGRERPGDRCHRVVGDLLGERERDHRCDGQHIVQVDQKWSAALDPPRLEPQFPAGAVQHHRHVLCHHVAQKGLDEAVGHQALGHDQVEQSHPRLLTYGGQRTLDLWGGQRIEGDQPMRQQGSPRAGGHATHQTVAQVEPPLFPRGSGQHHPPGRLLGDQVQQLLGPLSQGGWRSCHGDSVGRYTFGPDGGSLEPTGTPVPPFWLP